MSKPHGNVRFSVENGYEPVKKIEHLDQIFNLELIKLNDTIRQLTKRLDEQDRIIKELRAERGGQEVENGAYGGSNSGNATAAKVGMKSYASVVRGQPVKNAANVLELIIKEKREATSKRMNVVVSGLPEGKDDKADNDEILNALMTAFSLGPNRGMWTGSVKSRRVGKSRDDQPRMAFVEFSDKATRDTILLSASKLKRDKKYSKVYIRPDLIKYEVLMERELRKERNERNAKLPNVDGDHRYDIDKTGKEWYWGVRWGELRHIDRQTNRTFKPDLA